MSLLQLHTLLHRAKLMHAFKDADSKNTAAGDLQSKEFLELIAHYTQTSEAETIRKQNTHERTRKVFFFAIFV